ncbi:MAG: magnesium transporter [Bulleidia sp.]
MIEKMGTAELLEIIDHNEAALLHEYITDVNAIDIAVSARDLDDRQLWKLCYLLQPEDLARVLEQADEEFAVRMVQSITNDELIDVFGYMQKDDIADLIGNLPIVQRKALINQMLEGERKIICTLMDYPQDSAGGIMNTGYIALDEDETVGKGMTKIRQIANRSEVIETIYVVNHSHQLVGTANLRLFLTADKNTKIRDIMKEKPVFVHPEDDQEYAANLVSKYDLTSIPVVNHRGSILGIITVDDIIDVIVEEYNEDILELGGVSSEETLSSTPIESIRHRLPWLLVNLATAFLASLTVRSFESTISQVVALSATMTIVTGMGGNSANQVQSILVRQLSQDEISTARYIKAFRKELLVGLVDGLVTGAVTGVIVSILYHNIFLGLIILVAMTGNMIVAGTFGFLVPVVLKKLGIDPAVSSSIFVTTATDVLGFFIFLGLATLFLPYLL